MKQRFKILSHTVACVLLCAANALHAQNKTQPGLVLKGHIDGAPEGAKVYLKNVSAGILKL